MQNPENGNIFDRTIAAAVLFFSFLLHPRKFFPFLLHGHFGDKRDEIFKTLTVVVE